MRSIKKSNPKIKIRSPKQIQNSNFKIKSSSNLIIFIGLVFLIVGLLIFFLTFYPVVKEEVRYQIVTKKDFTQKKQLKPVDENFGIVIPKIAANAKVIANVDPFAEKEYQKALTKGVAHAKGTQLPDQAGNTFIFAHSSVDWYIANRYNSVFYLLNKLEKNDDVFIFYQKQKYHFQVVEKKVVEASEINYLKGDNQNKILTLMTCWPPGTNLKRLILLAKLVKIN